VASIPRCRASRSSIATPTWRRRPTSSPRARRPPLWDKAEMEAEAKRRLDMDIKGFVLPDTSERLGLPSFLLGARDQRGQALQPAIV